MSNVQGINAKGGSFLIFELGRYSDPGLSGWFGLPVDQVWQVIEPTTFTPVPLAPGEVLGLMNHHGRVVTVVDPAPVLGLSVQGVAVNHVVILRSGAQRPGNLGLQVRRIRGILSEVELEKVDVATGPCIAWAATAEKSVVHIVDMARFVERLGEQFLPPERRDSPQGVRA